MWNLLKSLSYFVLLVFIITTQQLDAITADDIDEFPSSLYNAHGPETNMEKFLYDSGKDIYKKGYAGNDFFRKAAKSMPRPGRRDVQVEKFECPEYMVARAMRFPILPSIEDSIKDEHLLSFCHECFSNNFKDKRYCHICCNNEQLLQMSEKRFIPGNPWKNEKPQYPYYKTNRF